MGRGGERKVKSLFPYKVNWSEDEFPWQCITLAALASAANPNTTFPLLISQRSSKDPEMLGCSVAAILASTREAEAGEPQKKLKPV